MPQEQSSVSLPISSSYISGSKETCTEISQHLSSAVLVIMGKTSLLVLIDCGDDDNADEVTVS